MQISYGLPTNQIGCSEEVLAPGAIDRFGAILLAAVSGN